MESIKTLYKIGYGPSSSHTMGPGYASERFLNKNKNAELFEVELFGSLALTGKGHMTDEIIKKILGIEKTKIIFNYDKVYDYHTNAMCFKAYKNEKLQDEWLVFSVGGGDLKELGENRKKSNSSVYPHTHMDEILEYIEKEQIDLVEYVNRFEEKNLDEYLKKVLDTMTKCAKTGIFTEGILPGSLKVERKAPKFYKHFLTNNNINELIYAYSLSVSEENASCNVIVTAPTCGASAVVPAILISWSDFYKPDEKKLLDALKVAGLIGNIIRTNASISGAEVGCQGEVGVACSMAAGMYAYLQGADARTIEYASEIALEHHLGLTCDPVDGLVQIPCIERNAIASLTSKSSAEYALLAGGHHNISLDRVIEVMNETGKDLQDKYKETSKGGLALKK